ncbi:MAG: AAA family ATPase [Pseudohongiellaceae bacterium]
MTPNTRYFLRLPSHQRAFNFIIEALQGDTCFTKITGEVGTGKTMLCRKVLNALDAHGDKYATVFIPNPVLNEEGTMFAIAEDLSLGSNPSSSYYVLLKLVTEELARISAQGKSVVLLIDEAQAMPEESLEAIRLLTTVKNGRDGRTALHTVLFGQPEFNDLLQRPALQELSRDLNPSPQLTPLDRDEVEAYLAHRLTKAGYNGSSLFTPKAVDLMHRSSKGVPRLINILAHKALMVAFGKGDYSVTDRHIQLAMEDTDSTQQQALRDKRSIRR